MINVNKIGNCIEIPGLPTSSPSAPEPLGLKKSGPDADAITSLCQEPTRVPISGFGGVLAAAQEGSEWAWEILVRDLAPRLISFSRSRGMRDPDALVGEVFVDLARNLGTFTGDEEAFNSWVFVIAYRRLSDEWRRSGRRPDERPSGIAPPSSRRSPSAEEEAMELLGSGTAAALLRSLTGAQRDVILLRVIAGLTLAETAEAMTRPVGAIKSLQRRGILALRREISRQGVSR